MVFLINYVVMARGLEWLSTSDSSVKEKVFTRCVNKQQRVF